MFLLNKENFVDNFIYISDSDLNSESELEDNYQTSKSEDSDLNSESELEDNYQTSKFDLEEDFDQMPDFLNNQSYFYDINIPSLNTIYFGSKYILLSTGVILGSIFILKAFKK